MLHLWTDDQIRLSMLITATKRGWFGCSDVLTWLLTWCV